MYEAIVNENKHEIAFDDDAAKSGTLNGEAFDLDIVEVGGESHFHVLWNEKSYRVEVVSYDKEQKTAGIKVNGDEFEVEVKDELDILLDKMGLSNLAAQVVSELKAPMPGLILDLHVKPGDEVKKGDNLLVLEAMKMENVIKSPADVVVKSIEAKVGDAVEKNQTIIAFE